MLLVGGPRFDYVPNGITAMKTYVDGGGRLLLLLDAPVALGKEPCRDNAALVAQLGEWGSHGEQRSCTRYQRCRTDLRTERGVPLVSSYESHPIVAPMKGTATAFPCPGRSMSKAGGKWTGSKLFSSSDNSYATTNLSSREIQIDPQKDKKGPLNLAVASSGGQSRIVVVGSSSWVANSFLSFNGNRDLF